MSKYLVCNSSECHRRSKCETGELLLHLVQNYARRMHRVETCIEYARAKFQKTLRRHDVDISQVSGLYCHSVVMRLNTPRWRKRPTSRPAINRSQELNQLPRRSAVESMSLPRPLSDVWNPRIDSSEWSAALDERIHIHPCTNSPSVSTS